MGIKSLAKSLMDTELMVFYCKLCDDLGQLTIPEMMKSSRNPEIQSVSMLEFEWSVPREQ
jgi:hypothetical protein